MRILVVSPCLPWPLHLGGNAAQFSTFKCLMEDHQFTLLCPVYDDAGVANAKELQAQLPLVNIRPVFLGLPAQAPLPKPGAHIRLARRAVRVGRKLLSPPTSSQATPPAEMDAPRYPFNPAPEKFISAVGKEIAAGTDLFQAEFAEMLSLGAWISKEIPKLFVHHQIHFVYAERFVKAHGETAYSNYVASLIKTDEINYLQKFQGVITFSEEDQETLQPYLGEERLFTSPFPIPADVGIADNLPSAFGGSFLFLASEDHDPNRDALEWLLAKIWPEIFRQWPSSQLVVIGRWSESARAKYAAPGVTFSGFVKDLATVMRGGIMLVPLRIGSGIRVKIMVAMAQGAPVVSTTVGSEGLAVRDGEHLLMRDDEPGFVAAAIQLAQDAELWKRLAVAGQSVSRIYSPEKVRQRRNEIYEILRRSNRDASIAPAAGGRPSSKAAQT